MKKRFIAILLTFSIILSMFSFVAYADAIECPNCGNAVYDTGFSVLFGAVTREMYYCEDCGEYLYTSFGVPGTVFNFSTGDAGLLDEYYDYALNGTGGTFETTTDDDGNTTTDYVANDTSNWYVTSDGQIQGKFVAYYAHFGGGGTATDGYVSYNVTSNSSLTPSSTCYFKYYVTVPYYGSYTYSYGDFGAFVITSSNTLYTLDSSDFYVNTSSTSIPSNIAASTSSVSYSLYFSSNVTSDDDNYFSLSKPSVQLWSPILYLTYDPTAYGFISNDYSSVTVNGDIITGDSIYYYDYTSNYSNVSSSNYTGAYYVYDSSDSGNYTVYNTDSSGDVVSSYYYDNSSGDTITYMTIYESDTFTPEEMYPSDTGDDSTSSDSSGNAWTELFSDLFSGIADFIAAIISGVLELLIALVDELVSAVTSLLDTVTNLFTSVLDFGGEFSGFIGSFFDWMPDEIVVLLQLSIALPLLLMVIKFLINLFV